MQFPNLARSQDFLRCTKKSCNSANAHNSPAKSPTKPAEKPAFFLLKSSINFVSIVSVLLIRFVRRSETKTMTNAQSITQTFSIPESNLIELESKLETLAKRAAKLNSETITWEIAEGVEKHQIIQYYDPPITRKDESGEIYTYSSEALWLTAAELAEAQAHDNSLKVTGKIEKWFDVEISGTTPHLKGWNFVATLEPIALDDGTWTNIVKELPGEQCPDWAYSKVGTCDHCKHNRRRKETFVVRHVETNTYKIVGRQCLKDFLGLHYNPHHLAKLAQLILQVAETCKQAESYDWCRTPCQESQWGLVTFLTWTESVISKLGWLSKTAAFEKGDENKSTASRVLYLLDPPTFSAEAMRVWRETVAEFEPSEEHAKRAEEAANWAKELQSNDNAYLHNIRTIAQSDRVTWNLAGYAASIAIAYRKAMEKEIERQEKVKRSNEHVGEVGKRQEFTVTVERLSISYGIYGETGIHNMTDEHGNALVWFASASSEWLEEGRTYRIKATVKDHSEYRERKQTVINRVSIIEEQA